MLDTAHLITFAAMSFAIIVVPGPSVLFVIGRGVALGRRAALATVVGNAAGAYVLVLLIAAGLGPLLERSERLLVAVKLAGAAYLLWLGYKAIRDRRKLTDALGAPVEPRRTWVILREGFVVGVLNPKVVLFFTAALPQFVAADGAPVPVQMAMLGLIFVAIALVSDSLWGLAAGTARSWLADRPRHLEGIGAVGGGLMIAVGIRLATQPNP
ncbi:MAG: LysE family translocator [Nocardioidaceae bacterium]